jgi:hypothetical protein
MTSQSHLEINHMGYKLLKVKKRIQQQIVKDEIDDLDEDVEDQEDEIERVDCELEVFSFDESGVSEALKKAWMIKIRRRIANHLLK